MGTSKAQPPSIPPESSAEQLDSWKEIAAYLKRDERTVRRWEAEGLPVHRHVHKKQASIYAYRTEVDAWWNNGRQRLEPTKPPRSRKQFLLWLMSGFVAAGLLGLLVYNASGLRKVRWARNQAVPEVARLVDQDGTVHGQRRSGGPRPSIAPSYAQLHNTCFHPNGTAGSRRLR